MLGNQLALETGRDSSNVYVWSTGSTDSVITISTPDNYHVSVTNQNNCFARDTIYVDVKGDAPNSLFSNVGVCSYDSSSFMDQSTSNDLSNVVQWNWDFGDGGSSVLQNPMHQYLDTGRYYVELTVTTDSGCSQTIIDTAFVYAQPISQLTVLSDTLCSGNTINLKVDSLFLAESWRWHFGDGNQLITNNDSIVQYTYQNSGEYDIMVIDSTRQGCIDTAFVSIAINPSPIANFNYQPACANEPLQFIDSTMNANNAWVWEWDFGNQSTQIGYFPNPTFSYDTGGFYLVSLTVRDQLGCVGSVQKTIQVSENPQANFVVTDFCLNTPIQVSDSSLTNDSIVKWRWNVINHSNQSIEQKPVFNFTYNTLTSILCSWLLQQISVVPILSKS